MESLATSKAIFYPTEIVLIKKEKNITINIDDIDIVSYNKPKIANYLPVLNLGSTPKLFEIRLNKEINCKKVYTIVIKYKEVLKIQQFFQKTIYIY